LVSKYWLSPPSPFEPGVERHQTVVLSAVPLTIGVTGAHMALTLPFYPIKVLIFIGGTSSELSEVHPVDILRAVDTLTFYAAASV